MNAAAILSALKGHVEAELGAGTVELRPRELEDLENGRASLYLIEYDLEELEWREQKVDRVAQMNTRQSSSDGEEASRAAMQAQLEAIEARVRGDKTLGGTVRYARVSETDVQSWPEYTFGVMVFRAYGIQ